MRHLYILLCLLVLTACDDGDIITLELEFDQELARCENDINSFLIYDTKEEPNQSLSLIIPRTDLSELLFTIPTPVDTPLVFDINATTVRFIYRTYNRAIINDELCDVITPGGLTILEDYEAPTGTVEVTVTVEDDDNDKVPTEFEGRGELDENGEYSNALDTDGDGIPNYLDEDDDNDNVKTSNEVDNSDGDNDPTTSPQDTDGDGILDYLDVDDDGDLTPTIEEDEGGDQNPLNDFGNNADNVQVPHFLNTLETTNYGSPGVIDLSENKYTRTVNTFF